jgi:hypothetical protein
MAFKKKLAKLLVFFKKKNPIRIYGFLSMVQVGSQKKKDV